MIDRDTARKTPRQPPHEGDPGAAAATGYKYDDKATGVKRSGRRAVSYIGNGGAKETGTAPQVTPGTTPDYYAQMEKLYQQMYSDQVKANDTALGKAQDQARKETAEQIKALGAQYQGTNRQLYRDYMEHRRTLPQQLAAQGYSGGLSESSLLRLRNSYEEGLNENERARLAQESGYNQTLSRQLFDAQMKNDDANRQARQDLYTRRAAVREAAWKDQQQRAAAMAAAGDFSEYGRLGFSKSEIRYLKEIWKRMNPDLV